MKIQKPKKVKREWGRELWIINEDYCGKILLVKKGYRGGLHFHKKKDECFYIWSGKVLMEAYGKKIVMKPGDVLRILPGQIHRFTGLQNSKIVEVETHHEDTDSYFINLPPGVRGERVPEEEFKKLLKEFS